MEIQSEFIKARISLDGAELKSLVDLDSNLEYMWSGDETYWKRTSPVLFPIVGKLLDDQYHIGKKFYNMTKHGFARDQKFSLIKHTADSLQLRLETNADILKTYPFKFTLDITYKVYGPKITISFEVKNIDRREILFSLGAHPAFNIPVNGGSFEDYFIEFEKEEQQGAYYLNKDLLNFSNTDDRTMFEGRIIPLTHELFYDDALIFKDLMSNKVSLKNKANGRGISVNFENWPYFGIWQPKDAPFVCLEPWYGAADAPDSNKNFFEKEGLVTLDSGKIFSCDYSILIY